jgi:thioesterase domain-containing protein
MEDRSATADPLERMRQLASKLAWTETLGRTNDIIAPLNDAGSLTPFYCVHSLSGKGTDYVTLARQLGPRQPFFTIQMPGRMRNPDLGGEVSPVSLEGLADCYVGALIRFQPEGPVALGGWSVGALIALEMARRLRAQGREVTLLVSFDLSPWNMGPAAAPAAPLSPFALIANAPFWAMRHRLMRQFSFRALGERAVKKATALACAAPADGSFAVGEFLDVTKYSPAHLAMAQTVLDLMLDYRPQSYDGAVQVYVAGSEVSFSHFARMKAEWRKVSRHAGIMRVAGNHRGMIEGAGAARLARHLGRRLAETSRHS